MATVPQYIEAPSLTKAIGRNGLIQTAIIGGLLLAVFWTPINVTVLYRWQNDPDWSHGWLVPLFSLYFINVHRDKLAAAVRKPSYLGFAVVLACFAVYCWTLWVTPISYLRPLCLIGSMLGLTLFLAGWGVLKIVGFPIAFLFLGVPLPQSQYVSLTMPLRRIASTVASFVLSLVPDLQTEISGVVIDYTYKMKSGSLNVEQACSGMRLTMAFVTLGVAMAYLGDKPVWQRVIMAAMCVPIAIFCNIIRVTSTGVLHIFKDEPIGQKFGFEALSHGTPHALLGMAMLPIALGLFALVGWLLSNLFIDDAEERIDGGVPTS